MLFAKADFFTLKASHLVGFIIKEDRLTIDSYHDKYFQEEFEANL